MPCSCKCCRPSAICSTKRSQQLDGSRLPSGVESLARVADKAITRKTQEFVGRDPSASGVAGALEATPAPSSKAYETRGQSSRRKGGREGSTVSIGEASRA